MAVGSGWSRSASEPLILPRVLRSLPLLPPMPRPLGRALPCLVLAVTAACVDGHRSLVEELARVAPARSIAGRLSIPLGYRPCPVRLPAEGSVLRADCPAQAGGADAGMVAARALDSLRAGADPALMHAVGMNELLWARGAGKRLDQSIWYLESAARLSERPAPVLADLAAAYLVRAERTQDPRDLLLALETASHAAELAPGDATALHNRALALDRFGLTDEAVEAWREFLAVDGASGWADEARARLAALTAAPSEPVPPRPGATAREVAAFADRTPQETGEHGWRVALGEWGAAVERGDAAGAARWLALADGLGTALERGGRDATLADAVRAIRQRAEDARATRALARAHRAHASGLTAYAGVDYHAAALHFAAARAGAQASPALRQWAEFFHGTSLVYVGRAEQGRAMLRHLAAAADTVRHPALAGRALWATGTTQLRQGRYQEALASYESAAGRFERAGEEENLGALRYLTGEAWYALGERPRAYATFHRAMLTLRPHRGSVWLHNLLSVTAQAATADGFRRAAAYVHDEGIRASVRTGSSAYEAEARLIRARMLAGAGHSEQARAELGTAEPLVHTLAPGFARAWLEEEVRLARAGILARADPRRAVLVLDSAVAAFAASGNPLRLLPSLVSRAEARLALGDAAGAVEDLDRVSTMVGALSARARDAGLRATMLTAARAHFDRLVMLHARAGRTREARQVLERSRAVLGPDPGVSPGRVPLPAGQAVVEYALIGDTLVTWVTTGADVRMRTATIGRAPLVQGVEKGLTLLELRADDAAMRPHLAALYDWLIRPVAPWLGPANTPLVVIADGEIAGVPFAALRDTTEGRFLVERHPLRFAPDLAMAARAPERAPPPRTALLVADPALHAADFPGLSRLPGAEAETRAIAAQYPAPRRLGGAAATRAAMVAALEGAEVVHYAGHAVFDDRRPEHSFLVLAADSTGAGARLSAAEMGTLRLPRLRLMVLSACQTLRAHDERSGGFGGFAGAVLATGAHGVVGSLWRVDDHLTAPLMVEFHRAYRASGDGASALRRAQLALLQSPDSSLRSPAAWAGFRYAGR